MNKIKNLGGGLKHLPKDERDFELGAIIKPINLNEIPSDFIVGESVILDQKDSDFCTAFAASAASAIEENETLNPYWSFAASKYLSGDPDSWGQDLRVALKVHTKFGAINLRDYYPGNIDFAYLRKMGNYPERLFKEAKKHQKQSYFKVLQGGYPDLFDAFRASLWQHRDLKQVIITGCMWRPTWISDPLIPKDELTGGFGHAFILIGQKSVAGQPYLVAQLSNGEDIGDKGKFYFPREVVNREFVYGAFMFVDIPQQVAGFLNAKKLNIKHAWWVELLNKLFTLPYDL